MVLPSARTQTLGSLKVDGTDPSGFQLSLMQLSAVSLLIYQPHTVQTAMSAENMLILAGAIPSFELFMASWKSMLTDDELQMKTSKNLSNPACQLQPSIMIGWAKPMRILLPCVSTAF